MTARMKFFWRASTILFSLINLMFLCGITADAYGEEEMESPTYSIQNLQEVSFSADSVGMKDCFPTVMLGEAFILTVCRGQAKKSDSGKLYLMLIENKNNEKTIRFRGPESGDAYYIRPTVYGQTKGGPWIVFAESGAEFSYGVGVYFIEKDFSMHFAGQMDVAIGDEDGPVSVVPFIRVQTDNGMLCFSFTRDVVKVKADGSYIKIPRKRIAFQYSSGRLTQIKSCRKDILPTPFPK